MELTLRKIDVMELSHDMAIAQVYDTEGPVRILYDGALFYSWDAG